MPDYPNLLVAMGASAGGLQEILKIVKQLPESFQGSIVVATHREPGRTNMLADILKHHARLDVREPSDDDEIDCATLYVGDASERIEVDSEGSFDVGVDNSDFARIRRIDDLFKSVASTAGKNAVGVVLSGMLWDGVEGLKAISDAGGTCIVQDPHDASFKSMPENALAAVNVDFVGDATEIAGKLFELSAGRHCN